MLPHTQFSPPAGPRKHFHLIAAEILFRIKDTGQTSAVKLNSILAEPDRDVPVRLLGKAQQAVQLRFYQNMGEAHESVEVVDVVILAVSYLGHMTEAAFHAQPGGGQLQPKTPANTRTGNA